MAMEGGGGGTLSELYQHSKRLLLTTRDGLERLERLEFSTSKGGVDSPELSFAVKRDIGQIQLLCVEMDRFWRSIAAKSQRDLWKSQIICQKFKFLIRCSDNLVPGYFFTLWYVPELRLPRSGFVMKRVTLGVGAKNMFPSNIDGGTKGSANDFGDDVFGEALSEILTNHYVSGRMLNFRLSSRKP